MSELKQKFETNFETNLKDYEKQNRNLKVKQSLLEEKYQSVTKLLEAQKDELDTTKMYNEELENKLK